MGLVLANSIELLLPWKYSFFGSFSTPQTKITIGAQYLLLYLLPFLGVATFLGEIEGNRKEHRRYVLVSLLLRLHVRQRPAGPHEHGDHLPLDHPAGGGPPLCRDPGRACDINILGAEESMQEQRREAEGGGEGRGEGGGEGRGEGGGKGRGEGLLKDEEREPQAEAQGERERGRGGQNGKAEQKRRLCPPPELEGLED